MSGNGYEGLGEVAFSSSKGSKTPSLIITQVGGDKEDSCDDFSDDDGDNDDVDGYNNNDDDDNDDHDDNKGDSSLATAFVADSSKPRQQRRLHNIRKKDIEAIHRLDDEHKVELVNGGSTSSTRAYYDTILKEFKAYLIKEGRGANKATVDLISAILKEGRKEQEIAKGKADNKAKAQAKRIDKRKREKAESLGPEKLAKIGAL